MPCHWLQTCSSTSKVTKPGLPTAPTQFPASSCSPHQFQWFSMWLFFCIPGTGSFFPSHPRGRRCCVSFWAPWHAGAVQPAGSPSSTGRHWAHAALAESLSSFHPLLFVACRKLASVGAEPSGKFTLSSQAVFIHWRAWKRQTGSSMVVKICYLYETRLKSVF